MLQKCEQQKNAKEKLVFQNLQKTTCKKGLWKPLFMKGGRGQSRNEESPLRALTPS